MSSTGTPTSPLKKKMGLGARIRGLVRRKKRKNKDGADDLESVVSHDVSLYSYDGGLPDTSQQEFHEQESIEIQRLDDLPNSALDPSIMTRIVEETSEEGEEDDDDVYNGGRPIKTKANHMISKKARELPMDRIIRDDEEEVLMKETSQVMTNSNGSMTASSSDSGARAENLSTGPLSLVLLLVDPSTLRFELLQLEFANPQDATIAEVLEQIQDPFWRPLPFVGVVDRMGNAYKSTTSSKKDKKSPKKKGFLTLKKQDVTPKIGPFLDQACQHRPPRTSPGEPHRDVLVGLLRNTSVEKTNQLARTILGEAKVVAMMEQNGYSLEGWKQDKQREATLETRAIAIPEPIQRVESSLLSRMVIGVLALVVMLGVIAYGVHSEILPQSMGGLLWNTEATLDSLAISGHNKAKTSEEL